MAAVSKEKATALMDERNHRGISGVHSAIKITIKINVLTRPNLQGRAEVIDKPCEIMADKKCEMKIL
jgi:hypothetical protein